MPLYWTSTDTRYAALSAAVPVGAAVLGTYLVGNDPNVRRFLASQPIPSSIPRCKFLFMATNAAAIAPFGYASYLVYKIGGGFDYTDTTVALGLYGSTILASAALVPVLKKQSAKYLSINAALVAVLATASAVAFYNIDKISGYWAIPFVLYTAGMSAAVGIKSAE